MKSGQPKPTRREKDMTSKLRVQYKKLGEIRFISHLDLIRTMERAIRRANIPIAFSQGFHPHPKIAFGPALALGFTSEAEFADFEVEGRMTPLEFETALARQLPLGLQIVAVKEIPKKVKSLSAEIEAMEYSQRLEWQGDNPPIREEFKEWINILLASDSIEVEHRTKRRVKIIDIRPYILEVKLVEVEGKKAEIGILYEIGKDNIRLSDIEEGWKKVAPDIKNFFPLRTHRLGQYVKRRHELTSPLEIKPNYKSGLNM